MTNVGHTPGPWAATEAKPENGWCQDAGWLVLNSVGNWFIDDLSEQDAHLIAAAPCMAAFVRKHAEAGDAEAVKLLERINGTA